jgi:hypothetical protein
MDEPTGFIVIQFNESGPLLEIPFNDPSFKHHRSENYGFIACYTTHRVVYPWHTIKSIEIHYNSEIVNSLTLVGYNDDGGGS